MLSLSEQSVSGQGASSALGAFYDWTPDWTLIEHLLWPQLCYRGMQRARCHPWLQALDLSLHQYSHLVMGIWLMSLYWVWAKSEGDNVSTATYTGLAGGSYPTHYLPIPPKTHMKTSKDVCLYLYERHIMNTYNVIRTLMEACYMSGSCKWKLWWACKFYVSYVT